MSILPVGAEASGQATGDLVWIAVSDALVAGITHDLNGRVSALTGLLSVVAPGEADPQVLALLRSEGERLDATVALLRLYPRGGSRGTEAIDPRELLPTLLALHACRDDRQDATVRLEIARDAPPARAERTWLARALLVLFARAGLTEGPDRGDFAVRAAGSAAEAIWSVAPHREPAWTTSPPGDPADSYLRTAAAFLAQAGGTLHPGHPGGAGWDVVLPAVTG